MNTERPVAVEEEVSLLWFAAVLVRSRKLILRFTLLGTAIALVVVLVRPRTYTSSFSFLAQGREIPQGGLASLAGQFGVSLASLGAQGDNPQLYADLLTTEDVLAPIAGDSVTIDSGGGPPTAVAEFFGADDANRAIRLQKTVKYLRTRVVGTTVASRTTGMVTVRVRTKSAEASRQIAQRLLDGLNHFNLVTRQSQARQERVFAEARLTDARTSLRAAEDRLQQFLESNRAATSPLLSFARDRLQRDVTFQQQVVTSLTQQYEENRIKEVRDTPVITVMERPRTAVLPDPGLRILILALGLAGGAMLGVVAVMVREAWARAAAEGGPGFTELAAELRRVLKARA